MGFPFKRTIEDFNTQVRTFYFLVMAFLILSESAVYCHNGKVMTSDSTKAHAKSQKSPRGAMLRSLLPGWGQFYNGQIVKGILVIGGQAALIYRATWFNKQASMATTDFARNVYVDKRNLMFWFMGVLTLLSMVDAYIDAHLADFDAGPNLSIRISPAPMGKGAGQFSLILQARF